MGFIMNRVLKLSSEPNKRTLVLIQSRCINVKTHCTYTLYIAVAIAF